MKLYFLKKQANKLINLTFLYTTHTKYFIMLLNKKKQGLLKVYIIFQETNKIKYIYLVAHN